MKARCHCGNVQVILPGPPAYMNDCNCTLCTSLGALWGYFSSEDVRIEGKTRPYQRRDMVDAMIDAHFCDECGAATHWILADQHRVEGQGQRMGVNMRLFDYGDLEGVELRFLDGRNNSGGEWKQRKPAVIIGSDFIL